MADQPQKKLPPEQGAPPRDGRPSGTPPQANPPGALPGGWHEPPVEEGSSRPVIVESWFPPDNPPAVPPAPAAPPAAAPTSPPPAAAPSAPPQEGAWYKPLNAELDALLAGAGETIIEKPAPPTAPPAAPARPPAAAAAAAPSQPAAGEGWSAPQALEANGQGGDDQNAAPQAAAPDEEQQGTRILTPQEMASTPAISEPPAPAGSTPVPETTPPQAGRGLTAAEAAFLAEQRASGAAPEPVEPGAAGKTAAPQATPVPVPQEPAIPRDATPPPQATPAPQPVSPAVQAAAAPPQPSPFDQVERKVNVLRARYQAGSLTRDELQNELRSLMILDDQGRWWMIGLESNKWYYYDGRDWTPGIPPGRDEPFKRPAAGSALPTETGLQQAITPQPTGVEGEAGRVPHIELDEDGMPLPARVPQEDPGATLVSANAPFIEPYRSPEAPTLTRGRQVDLEIDQNFPTAGTDADQMTQPSRPGVYAGSEQPTLRTDNLPVPAQTIRSEPVRPGADRTVVRGEVIPAAAAAAGAGVTAAAVAEAVSKPKPRIGEFPQPDYGEALGFSRNSSTYWRWSVRFGALAIIGGMALTLLVLIGLIGYYFYKVNQYQGAVASLSNRASTFETTQIFGSDGTLLAEFNDPNTGVRREVPLDQVSPWLLFATIATENETFYTDPGFSVFAILRATYQNLTAGGTVSGASTITQQLARALVLETELASERTAERKVVEIIVASEISRKYSKNEILQIYLNEIFYGNRAYGIEAAAETYFHKSAADLDPAEAAFLAGLPQAPAQYDPVINREAAMQRMDTVLRLMSEANGTGCLALRHQDATSWAVPQGGSVCITAAQQQDGSTVYYYQTPSMSAPEELTLAIAQVKVANYQPPSFNAKHPHFVNYVWQQLEDTYGAQAIYNTGFRVYTTLDENIQTAAEQAVSSQLSQLQAQGVDATNASVVVMRPSDGAVVAMVGSADYNNEQIDGQVNVAFTAQQPGSSIKPLVYLTAFEPDANGRYWTPATVIWDVYTDFNGYVPVNFDRLYHGPETARFSLANSLNVPAVKTMNFIGLERFMDMAQRAGLTFPLGDPISRQAGLPTALGAVEVRLFDMVEAYAMLANYGRRVDPYGIAYIEDTKGNRIYQANPSPEGLQVVKPEYAYLITSILADNEARTFEFGRGWPMELQGGRPAAVKTGTTDDSRDIWTIGYTPQYVTGVWVGNTDNRPVNGAYGYTGAAPIWNDVMEAAHTGLAIQPFNPPSGIIQAQVCSDTGAQTSGDCPGGMVSEVFAASAPPPSQDKSIFQTLDVDAYTGLLVNQNCQTEVERRTFLAIDDPAAFNWINQTGEGAAWAQAHGLDVPVMPPPTQYCDPNQPRPNVIFANPPDGSTVQGTIPLRGALTMPDFNRFEMRYATTASPADSDFSQPFVVDTNQRPEGESLLGEFDTRTVPNGPLTIRLIVIDNFGRSVHRDVHLTVNNPAPTPEPTQAPAPTQNFAPAGATPIPGGGIPSPTLAPTLTPTWTLTPTPQ